MLSFVYIFGPRCENEKKTSFRQYLVKIVGNKSHGSPRRVELICCFVAEINNIQEN